MNATRLSELVVRRRTATVCAVLLTACGGGGERPTEPNADGVAVVASAATPEASRERALAVAPTVPYYTITDLTPLIAPYSNICNILYVPTLINNNGTLVGPANVAQCNGSIYGSQGYALQPGASGAPTYFSFSPSALNEVGIVAGSQVGPYPSFSRSTYIGLPDNSLSSTWMTYFIPGTNLAATSINNNNQAVGTFVNSSTGERGSTLFSNGQLTFMGLPSGMYFSQVNDINDSGVIVGAGYLSNCNTNCVTAIRYRGGSWDIIGSLAGEEAGGAGSVALGINNAGQIIGFTAVPILGGTGNNQNGWVLDGSSRTQIPLTTALTPGATYSVNPRVINNYGNVIGESYQNSSGTPSVPISFIYSGGESYNINELVEPNSGLIITQVFDINDKGQIIAQALGTDNLYHPVRLDPTGANPFPRTSSETAPSDCSITATPASLPAGGGAVTLAVACQTGNTPSTFVWTGGFAAGFTTNPVFGNVSQTTTFTVVASNAGGISAPANVIVAVTPPPAACASQVTSWTVGTSNCSATYPGGQSGATAILSDIVAPETGTVTASCTNGQLTLTVPVCTTAPPPIPTIDLSAVIPTVTQAPPVSAFPSPTLLLRNSAAFISANQSNFNPGIRTYIQTEILQLTNAWTGLLLEPLDPFTKDFINAAADNLQDWGSVLTLAQSIADIGKLQASYSPTEAAFYLSSIVRGVVSANPYAPVDSQDLKLAKRAADLIHFGWESGVAGASGLALGITANIFIWTDYFPEAARNFANDPPALIYDKPVPVLLRVLPSVVGTQNDLFLGRWNSATLRSIAFLEAVNASFDRYAAALQAGDNLSAATQLAAYLHYLRLFIEAFADAKESFTQLPVVLAQAGVVGGTGNEATIQLMQSAIAGGLPPTFANFLVKNGLPIADLPTYQNTLMNFRFQSGPAVYSSIATATRIPVALFSKKIQIDISPHTNRNLIRLSSAGTVQVAIISNPTFDATQLDPGSVVLSGAHPKFRAKKNKYACRTKYSNNDRLLDLVCDIPINQLNIVPTDTSAILTAITINGQRIAGVDLIRVIP